MIEQKGVISIPATETIDDDLFVAGDSLDFAGTLKGSIFAGAGTVNITGKVNGDVIVGAGSIILTKAQIGGNLIVGAGQVTIDQDSSIGGSIIAGAGNLSVLSPVSRNVMAGANALYLNSTVGNEARLAGSTVELGPKANIKGNLTYALKENDSQLKQDQAASVAGTISRYTPPSSAGKDIVKAKADFAKFGAMAHKGWLIVTFLGSLLVGFLLLKLFPKTTTGLADQITDKAMPSLGTGFLIVIAIIPALLVLALTVIGLPLAGMLFLLFSLELCVGKLVSSYALGHFVAKQSNWNKLGVYAVYSIGLAIFFLLRAIPVIGWVVSVLATWTGLGAIWLYTRAHLKNL